MVLTMNFATFGRLIMCNRYSWIAVCLALHVALAAGCGTTRTTNTQRTATEQLLISDAIDRAVGGIDFTKLAGQTVYFDDKHLNGVVDSGYLISSFRQHMLASGCILKTERDDATYVVEPRAGAIGTDNYDLLFGMPAVNLPQFGMAAGIPPTIPEIPIAKRGKQKGIAKIAVFAYHRETGAPAWQSGIANDVSTSNDIWVLGAGPFKRGTIYDGTSFTGDNLSGTNNDDEEQSDQPKVARVGEMSVFDSTLGGQRLASNPQPSSNTQSSGVQQASGTEPIRNAYEQIPDTGPTDAADSGAPQVHYPPGRH